MLIRYPSHCLWSSEQSSGCGARNPALIWNMNSKSPYNRYSWTSSTDWLCSHGTEREESPEIYTGNIHHLRMHTFGHWYTCVSYDEARSRTFRSTSMMIQSQPYFENPGRIVFMFLTYFAFASWIFWSIELSHLKPEINHTIKNISVVQNVKHRHIRQILLERFVKNEIF